jgi:hypothetical protein
MRKLFYLFVLSVAMAFASCSSNSDEVAGTSGPRDVSLLLTDAPAWYRFQAVNLDVKGIKYITKDSVWQDASFTPGLFNVKLLSNGDSALLSKIHLPNGDAIRQIQFILGSNSNVVLADGTVKPLAIASKQDTVLKIRIDEKIPAKGSYSIMLDFNIARSIFRDYKGNYVLLPMIRAFVVETTSQIQGFVLPQNIATKVFVVNGTDTVSTVSDVKRGNFFKLAGFAAGKYTVQFMPVDSARVTHSVAVTVKYGFNVNMGPVRVIK